MTPDELKRQMEDADKDMLIERDVIMRLEKLNREVIPARRDGLKRMTKDEIQHLAQRLKDAGDGKEVTTMIFHAITASDADRRKAGDEKDDDTGPTKRLSVKFTRHS